VRAGAAAAMHCSVATKKWAHSRCHFGYTSAMSFYRVRTRTEGAFRPIRRKRHRNAGFHTRVCKGLGFNSREIRSLLNMRGKPLQPVRTVRRRTGKTHRSYEGKLQDPPEDEHELRSAWQQCDQGFAQSKRCALPNSEKEEPTTEEQMSVAAVENSRSRTGSGARFVGRRLAARSASTCRLGPPPIVALA